MIYLQKQIVLCRRGWIEKFTGDYKRAPHTKRFSRQRRKRTQKDVAQDSSDLFQKQFGQYDISQESIEEYQNDDKYLYLLDSDNNNVSSMIADYKDLKLLEMAKTGALDESVIQSYPRFYFSHPC